MRSENAFTGPERPLGAGQPQSAGHEAYTLLYFLSCPSCVSWFPLRFLFSSAHVDLGPQVLDDPRDGGAGVLAGAAGPGARLVDDVEEAGVVDAAEDVEDLVVINERLRAVLARIVELH